MTDVLKIIDENKHIKGAIVIVIAIIVYVIAGKILKKGVNKFVHSKKIENKTKTYIKVISNLLRYTFILCILLFILQLNGINITAILTGVGVVGVIGGVALQDTLKDLIMGVNIILEDLVSKENINNIFNAVKYIFENYSEYNPVLTGSVSMYLQGIDFGDVKDVDIIFFIRKIRINKKVIKDEIFDKFKVKLDIFIEPYIRNEKTYLKTKIDDVEITYETHPSIYELQKTLFPQQRDKERRLRQFKIYEEWLKHQETE